MPASGSAQRQRTGAREDRWSPAAKARSREAWSSARLRIAGVEVVAVGRPAARPCATRDRRSAHPGGAGRTSSSRPPPIRRSTRPRTSRSWPLRSTPTAPAAVAEAAARLGAAGHPSLDRLCLFDGDGAGAYAETRRDRRRWASTAAPSWRASRRSRRPIRATSSCAPPGSTARSAAISSRRCSRLASAARRDQRSSPTSGATRPRRRHRRRHPAYRKDLRRRRRRPAAATGYSTLRARAAPAGPGLREAGVRDQRQPRRTLRRGRGDRDGGLSDKSAPSAGIRASPARSCLPFTAGARQRGRTRAGQWWRGWSAQAEIPAPAQWPSRRGPWTISRQGKLFCPPRTVQNMIFASIPSVRSRRYSASFSAHVFWVRHVDALIWRKSGDAGPQRIDAERAAALDQLGLRGQAGPRADQAHLALEHVPELRQLVELQPAQGPPGLGDGSLADLVRRQRPRALVHGPELQAAEGFFVPADRSCAKKTGPGEVSLIQAAAARRAGRREGRAESPERGRARASCRSTSTRLQAPPRARACLAASAGRRPICAGSSRR